MRNFVAVIFSLVLFAACKNKSGTMDDLSGTLLAVKELNYPSGSTINFYKGNLYLMGDDATDIVILDTAFNIIKTVPLFPQWSGRVAKSLKADIESSSILKGKQGDELWLFGSGSVSPHRDSLFKFSLENHSFEKVEMAALFSRMKQAGIAELNIEGTAFLKKTWLFGNRSNANNRTNFIIAVDPFSSADRGQQQVKIFPLKVPVHSAGLSGMTYFQRKDLLFLTFSEENTSNAYDDGEMGQSYLGLINNISKQLSSDTLTIDRLFPLASIDSVFNRAKVESISLGRRNRNSFIVYLVADNDDGKTLLFKLRLQM